jgi:hypothetical protein
MRPNSYQRSFVGLIFNQQMKEGSCVLTPKLPSMKVKAIREMLPALVVRTQNKINSQGVCWLLLPTAP